MIRYDYLNDVMIFSGRQYALLAFRKWLLSNHEQLCSGHFICAIKIGGKVKFTYDWQHIYFVAEQYQFTKQFIDEINSSGTPKIQ